MPDKCRVIVSVSDSLISGRIEEAAALWGDDALVSCEIEAIDMVGGALWGLPQDKTILFLDDDHLETAEQAEQAVGAEWPAVILVSSDEEKVIGAYRHHLRYAIRESFSYRDIEIAMGRCRSEYSAGIRWLEVSFHRKYQRIPMGLIMYVTSTDRNEADIRTGAGTVTANFTRAELSEQLPSPPFVHIRKDTLVHIGRIRSLDEDRVVMTDGEVLGVAKPMLFALRTKYDEWRSCR